MTVATEVTKVNYSLRNAGGTIILPEWAREDLINLKVPNETELFDQDSVQKYPIGTQLRKGDTLWRYCRADAAMADPGFLKGNYHQCPGKAGNSTNSGFEGGFYGSAAAQYATSFSIADTAAVKNEYEGAILVIYDDTTSDYIQHRVLGNDVTNATYTTLYIAEPGFKNAYTTQGITVYLNPYMGIRTVVDSSYMSALGYARQSITSGYFFWMVTAGPISCITGASTWPGQTARYRDVYCNTDGSLIGYNAGYQRVGYLLARTASDYGDNLIMLQLDQ